MIDKRVILTEGDSWTAGDIIDPKLESKLGGFVNHPDNDQYRLPRVWPGKLSKYTGATIINTSVAGSSNDGILRRTINKVLELEKSYKIKDILVVVGFTSPERKDFYYKNGSTSAWDTMYPLDIEADHLSPDRKLFYKEYAKIYWNEEEYISRYIQSVLLLHSFLENKGIQHIFFNAFYETQVDGLLNNKPIENELNRLQVKYGEGKLEHLELNNTLIDYLRVHQEVFVNTSFKSYIGDNPDAYEQYHPTEDSHSIWAKLIRDFYYSKYTYCITDNVNTATLHAPSKEQLELYKHIPEINEVDNRGFPICRPLFSTSDMHCTLGLRQKPVSELKSSESFLYITLLHHDNNLAFKHIDLLPEYVLQGAREHKCKIIFDNSLEGHDVEEIIPTLYESLNKLNIPAHQVYYVTNNLYAERHHQEYVANLVIDNYVNVISFMYNVSDVKRLIYSKNIVQGGRLPQMVDIDKLIKFKTENLNGTSTFLKVNRTGRAERNLFMLFINKHNLYHKFKISFPEYGEQHSYTHFPDITSEENIESLLSKIPFDIDQTDKDNHGPPGYGQGKFDADLPFQIKHYDSTFVSIVMCAFPHENACHLHSSTFNPIYCGHPVIQYGPVGHIAEMKKRGFKTFDKWWDESYDKVEDDWERLKVIFDVVETLSKKSPNEMLKMYIDMKDILQYNSDLIYYYHVNNNLTNRIITNGL